MQKDQNALAVSFQTQLSKLKGLPLKVYYSNKIQDSGLYQIDLYIGDEKSVVTKYLEYNLPMYELYIGETSYKENYKNDELLGPIQNILISAQEKDIYLLNIESNASTTFNINMSEYNVIAIIERTFGDVISVHEHILYASKKTDDIILANPSSKSLSQEQVHHIKNRLTGKKVVQVTTGYASWLSLNFENINLNIQDYWVFVKDGLIEISTALQAYKIKEELLDECISDITIENYVIRIEFSLGKELYIRQSGKMEMFLQKQ